MSLERSEVVVVGGGLAGLAAAWRLAEDGFAVVVLERERGCGGRAASESLEGFEFDPSAPVLTPADRSLLEMARASSAAPALLPLRPLARAQLHRGAVLPIDPIGLFGVAQLPGISMRQALRVTRLGRLLRRFASSLDPAAPERAALLDDRSVSEFGRLYFGSQVVEHWMQPTLEEFGLEDPGQTSRVVFLLRHVATHWVGPATFRAPLDRLTDALRQRLGVRLSSDVERIEPLGDRGFSLHVREQGRLSRFEARAVVLAVPADEMVRVAGAALTGFELAALRRIRYSGSITATVGLGQGCAPVATRVRVPRSEGGPFAVLQLEPAGAAGRAPDGEARACLVARSSWSRAHLAAPVEAVAKELRSEFERLFPHVAETIRFLHVHRYPQALPQFEVGHYRVLERLRRLHRERRREGRRLYLAGDMWMAPCLEGAVCSGLRAAREIRDDLSGSAQRLTGSTPPR